MSDNLRNKISPKKYLLRQPKQKRDTVNDELPNKLSSTDVDILSNDQLTNSLIRPVPIESLDTDHIQKIKSIKNIDNKKDVVINNRKDPVEQRKCIKYLSVVNNGKFRYQNETDEDFPGILLENKETNSDKVTSVHNSQLNASSSDNEIVLQDLNKKPESKGRLIDAMYNSSQTVNSINESNIDGLVEKDKISAKSNRPESTKKKDIKDTPNIAKNTNTIDESTKSYILDSIKKLRLTVPILVQELEKRKDTSFSGFEEYCSQHFMNVLKLKPRNDTLNSILKDKEKEWTKRSEDLLNLLDETKSFFRKHKQDLAKDTNAQPFKIRRTVGIQVEHSEEIKDGITSKSLDISTENDDNIIKPIKTVTPICSKISQEKESKEHSPKVVIQEHIDISDDDDDRVVYLDQLKYAKQSHIKTTEKKVDSIQSSKVVPDCFMIDDDVIDIEIEAPKKKSKLSTSSTQQSVPSPMPIDKDISENNIIDLTEIDESSDHELENSHSFQVTSGLTAEKSLKTVSTRLTNITSESQSVQGSSLNGMNNSQTPGLFYFYKDGQFIPVQGTSTVSSGILKTNSVTTSTARQKTATRTTRSLAPVPPSIPFTP